MSTEGNDDRFGRDDPTEPGVEVGLGNTLRNLGLALHEVVRDIGETARLIDALPAHDRYRILFDLAEKLGEVGGITYDASRIIREIALTAK